MKAVAYWCTFAGCHTLAIDEVSAANRWCRECKRWDGDVAPTNPLWQTRDGAIMPISAMTDSHLQYSINKILNSADWRKHYFDPLMQELKRRKELRVHEEALAAANDGWCQGH